MVEAPQISLAPEQMQEQLKSGELTMTAGQFWAGFGEWYPMAENITEIREPVALLLLDFEYRTTPETLIKIVQALRMNWYMFASGGGSAHVIVDKPMSPLELPLIWARVYSELLIQFPSFNDPVYSSLWSGLVKIGKNPLNIKEIDKLAEDMLKMTAHVDESVLQPGRVFPWDLRFLGHNLQRLADFIRIQYLSEYPYQKLLTLPQSKYADVAGIAYLRFTKKHGVFPELIAMEYQRQIAVKPNLDLNRIFLELPLGV